MALRVSVVRRIVFLMFIVSTFSYILFLRYVSRRQIDTVHTEKITLQIYTENATEESLQNKGNTKYKLLFVAIYTAPRHHERRNAVRETWMKKCVKRNEVVCWFITNAQDAQGRALTGPLREKLDNESSIYGDILLAQTPGGTNFARTYIWMAQWAHEHYDFQYLLRVDDDYFICFDKFLLELEFYRPKQKLFWGWLHCSTEGVVTLDASFQVVTRDIIESIISRINSTLLCHPYEGQAMGMWLKDYPGLVIFGDNKRLFHTSFDSKEKASKRKEICQTALGIHKSFPEEMRIYWNVYQKEPKNATYIVPPVVFSCELPFGVNYKAYGKRWFAVPKLCKENPIWNTTYLGRSERNIPANTSSTQRYLRKQ